MSTYLSTYWTLFDHLVDYNSTSLIRSCPSCSNPHRPQPHRALFHFRCHSSTTSMDQRQLPFSNPFSLCEPSQDVFPLIFYLSHSPWCVLRNLRLTESTNRRAYLLAVLTLIPSPRRVYAKTFRTHPRHPKALHRSDMYSP